MKVIVDTQSGSSFSIGVDYWDTVLAIKQKIEKSKGIPVFKQTLFFQGNVLQDHLYTFVCQFLHNSRLFLFISADDNTNQNNNDQVPHQTQESPSAPTNPIHDEFVNNQDLPVMSNNDQVRKPEESQMALMNEFFGIQDSPEGKNNQGKMESVELALKNSQRNEKYSSAPLNPIDEFVNNQGWPVMSNNDQVLQREESPLTVESWKEFLGVQDSPERRTNQVLHQTEQSPLPSNSFGETIYSGDRALTTEQVCKNQLDELLGPKDLPPVTVGSRRNRNQVVQTEQSSPSDSHKEIIRISDSPVKKKIKTSPMNMTVMVQPFEETRRIPLEVNARDNVEEMRKELVKMQQRGELNLPERYFFIHKQAVLDEDQSFWWNGVAHGDTIEIFRGYVTIDQRGSTIISGRNIKLA